MKDKILLETIKVFENAGKKLLKWRDEKKYTEIILSSKNKYKVDLILNDYIIDGLSKITPGVQIISEENFISDFDRPREYWLIDPLDGTLSWANGFDGFVTQGALIEDNNPILSVVYQPVKKNMYHAIIGSGFFINNIKFNRNKNSNRPLTIVDNTPTPHGIAKKLFDSFPDARYIESGSIGLKCVLVAMGLADIFIKDVIVRDWDVAPAFLMLEELGCKFSTFEGKDFAIMKEMEKKGLIVCNNQKTLDKILNAKLY